MWSLRNWRRFRKSRRLKMATEKVTLYDLERDIVVHTFVSPADAQRISTDLGFATELLQKLTNQEASLSIPTDDSHENVGPDTNSESNEKLNSNEVFEIEDSANVNSDVQESEGCLYRWTSPCVMLFLETYKSMEVILHSGTRSQKKISEKIAKELQKKGYDVTEPQCASKLRSLKKSYKSNKDHNSKSGNDRKTWQYFNIMKEIFAKKVWCDPIAVASSTGQTKLSETSDSVGRSDSGYSS
ncbi:hypothetical protein PV328_004246 [Microctonus aethiopoides]|uniref:Myb/SANT-like DNA-binding domain-containing protein n=1 Tax=Microctonus aethiopoides TaxID=144406 RepID=A0AA39FAA6_9HYME|nr:hypothetical protein PV328_004246 [Microctonus aethiopoides]